MPVPQKLLEDIINGKFDEECLTVCNADLNDDDVIKLVKALKNNKKIIALALRSNLIGDGGARALSTLKHITSLDLTDNCIGPIGAAHLAPIAPAGELPADSVVSKLTDLNLSGNRAIGDEGAIAISKSNILERVAMSGCEIGNDGALAILSNPKIEELDISANNFNSRGVKSIRENKSLLTVNFSHNNIGLNGAKAIASNSHLKKVFLGSNLLGDKSAKFLSKNTSIIELDLSQNRIRGDGFLALCQNPVLEILSLSSNKICFKKNKPLPKAQALKLIELNLDYNKIKDAPEEPLKSFMTAFPKLKKLNVSNNDIGEKGALIFSQFKKTLKELDLDGPKVPDELRSFGF